MDPRNGPEASPIASVLSRSDKRRANAERVMSALGLFERWAVYGRPVLVGSVAYDLVVAPDIDMEIYCERPRIEDGFTVAARLALEPGVQKVRFSNEMQGPAQGLY